MLRSPFDAQRNSWYFVPWSSHRLSNVPLREYCARILRRCTKCFLQSSWTYERFDFSHIHLPPLWLRVRPNNRLWNARPEVNLSTIGKAYDSGEITSSCIAQFDRLTFVKAEEDSGKYITSVDDPRYEDQQKGWWFINASVPRLFTDTVLTKYRMNCCNVDLRMQ